MGLPTLCCLLCLADSWVQLQLVSCWGGAAPCVPDSQAGRPWCSRPRLTRSRFGKVTARQVKSEKKSLEIGFSVQETCPCPSPGVGITDPSWVMACPSPGEGTAASCSLGTVISWHVWVWEGKELGKISSFSLGFPSLGWGFLAVEQADEESRSPWGRAGRSGPTEAEEPLAGAVSG